jgi:cation diffusion facilitator family transporter
MSETSRDGAHDATHDFLAGVGHSGERRTRIVVLVTLAMMVIEVVAGVLSGSMALLADGWHMGSHASALGIALYAYAFARKHTRNPNFAFGTWKVWILGGYTSAVVLALIALLVGWEAGKRLLTPHTIHSGEAIAVAVIGLLVNLVCALVLKEDAPDEQGAPAASAPASANGAAARGAVHDHNRRAAYLHVVADALTSVLAIVALLGARYLGWNWLDCLAGLVGAVVIAKWSVGLLRETSRILVDADVHSDVRERVVSALRAAGVARVADVHVWRVGPASLAVIASVETREPSRPSSLADAVRAAVGARHVTIEVAAAEELPAA